MVPDHDEGADLPFCLGICFPAIWILFVEKGMMRNEIDLSIDRYDPSVAYATSCSCSHPQIK